MKSPIGFIKEAQVELKKVTWPTRAETARLTRVVIIVSLIVSIYLGSADYLFNFLIKYFVK